MSMTVADLDVRMNASGNLESQLTSAEQMLRQIDSRARSAEQTMSRMSGPGNTFRNDMQRAEQQASGLQRAGQNANREMQNMEGPGNRFRSDMQRAERAADDLGNSGRRAGQEFGRGVEQGAQRAERAMEQAADAGADAVGDAGSEGGSGFVAGFSNKIKGLGGKGGPIAMALVGVAALGLVAGAQLMDAIKQGMESQADADLIQAQLGIDDETMGRIAKASADAYVNVFGESIKGNMESARQLFDASLIDTSATTNEIQSAIEKVETLNGLLGSETPDTVRALQSMVKSGLVDNLDQAVDVMAHARTMGLDAQGDLIDSVWEYSIGWKNAGVSANTALALIKQSMQNGAPDADRMSDGLREFGRRMTEEGDAIKETFTSMGLDAEDMFEKLKNGGEEGDRAFTEMVDAMRNIEDPIERGDAVLALFGDTVGDFSEAFEKMDVTKATADFGDFEGAAKRAADTIGDNTASKIEAANRQIEVSMNSVKASMAEAFGPTLAQIATWVSTHKPEIIAFFVAIADAALATTQGILTFVSSTMRGLGEMLQYSSVFFEQFIGGLGRVSTTLGGIIKHIPGMQGVGESMENAGKAVTDFGDDIYNSGVTLTEWADKVDEGNVAFGKMREGIADGGAEAVASAELFRALGADVAAVPDDKTIVVKDNSPEAKQRFEKLGIQIEEIPGTKDFKLVANTQEGQDKIDAFIKANTGRAIPITMMADWSKVQAGIDNPQLRAGAEAFSPESGYVHYADGGVREPGIGSGNNAIVWNEAGPEAYIPLDGAKRARSTALLREVANRFGMNLTEMANGGILDTNVLTRNAKGIEGANYVWGGWGNGWNTDCSGAQARMANMMAYGDPETGGRFGTATQGGALAARGFKNGKAPAGVPSYEVGWRNGGPGGGHTAGSFVFADGARVNVEMGGKRGNGQYGGPTGSLGFENVMYMPLASSAGVAGPAGAAGPSTGGSTGSGTTGTPSAPSGPTGPVDVNVKNWPPAMLDPSGGGAKARLGFALYADGGTVPGVGNRDTEAALLTPGEEVTPPGPAAKHRGLLKAIARDDVAGYALGGTVGFGGFTTQKPNAKLNFRNALSLLGGAAMFAASGWNNEGKFQGFDTGRTDIPGLEAHLAELKKIAEKPTVVIEHAEIKADDPQELVQKTNDPLQNAISTMRV